MNSIRFVFAVMPLVAFSAVTPIHASSPLGEADGFTVFVLNNYQGNNTDCTGRIAVGKDAQFNNMGVGSSLSNSAGTRDDLIVGDDLTWNNGQNFNGNTQVGDQTQLNSVGTPNGTVDSNVPIDFDAAETALEALSDELAAVPGNGTVTTQWGQIYLTGTDPDINVFQLDSLDFFPCYGFHVSAPAGSTVLVNITGGSVMLNWFQPFLTGVTPDHLFFNFPDCTTLQMNGIGWKGSILAPTSTMQFNNGQIDGALVIGDLQGNGESHHMPFTGDLPVEGEEEFVVGSFD
ncbi:MAG: choice-of-anchor A family protein [Phycisphaerales bacterium]|jgi:choice-of-anchor A domain-containing protein|nr:choice-of-anchor A family protein [Phycisphaerales bacterium]MDP6987631.1 choice-of-anchor A family protein [Phycisphaerales bacterium]